MLEGKNVNLRLMEKDDLPLMWEWFNRPEVFGEYNPLHQMSKADVEKMFENPHELKPFIVEKKDGSKIGFVAHFYVMHTAGRFLEIGYSFVPAERGKGYCTEAATIMVDYLFLSKDVGRIQAMTDQRNVASQRVLEKVGFKKEGTLRKGLFARGEWRDACVFSILREEWKAPRILKDFA
ncbi:MAG: GNAT family protein [Nitrososphaerales archaeon]